MTQEPRLTTSGAWADNYRDRWKWDKIAWGSHCVDCYPSNCPLSRLRARRAGGARGAGGRLPHGRGGGSRHEPGRLSEGGVLEPDAHGEERVLYPLRRAGERGEGRWQRISWDEALSEIADAMLDAIQEAGPRSIVRIGTPGEGGTQSMILASGVFNRLGVTSTDVQSEINDFNPGLYATFGRFDPVASNDDWFHSELLLIWANNPSTAPSRSTTTSPRPVTTAARW